MDGDRVEDVRFERKGCAISMASALAHDRSHQGQRRADIDKLPYGVGSLLTEQERGALPRSRQPGRYLGACVNFPRAREVRQPVPTR